jgi:hypothetical protein
MQVAKKEVLKDLVAKTVKEPKIAVGSLFLAGVSRAKDYKGRAQMMLEIVQKKNLRSGSSKVNIMALANIGDERFNSGVRAVRVWLKVTAEGFDTLFPEFSVKGAAIEELVQKLAKDETVMIFGEKIKAINIGEETPAVPYVRVVQFSEGTNDGLPEKLTDILEKDENAVTEEEAAYVNGLRMQTAEGVAIVDDFGNQVYETTMLSYGEEDNIIISKQLLTDFEAKKARAEKAKSKEDVNDLIASLAE